MGVLEEVWELGSDKPVWTHSVLVRAFRRRTAKPRQQTIQGMRKAISSFTAGVVQSMRGAFGANQEFRDEFEFEFEFELELELELEFEREWKCEFLILCFLLYRSLFPSK